MSSVTGEAVIDRAVARWGTARDPRMADLMQAYDFVLQPAR
ncbi:hypothetical protein NIIDNTM18_46760 [Mycolicibacterium litorale]|uniref:Uncharacterized protein n=1 Tax=Mycolicibacterium litorale TaxID=758802 RepID=A0A6S6PHD8_9MYCO|nr:hypothetical protein [Mycolicibacterium litorale]BCI55398.1 hypothetical protein NIIDNTM18_46760 [Mycolicibacterium litorale]